jgi:hypothetical protein
VNDMSSIQRDWSDGYDDLDEDELRWSKPNRRRNKRLRLLKNPDERGRSARPARVESRDGTFRCRHCKTVVGVPISGGRHRNHCPNCLYSRHVDERRPGDRASTCRSMMRAIGVRIRTGGEQELVHRCLGCGIERRNRVAADDNVVAVMHLPLLGEQAAERSAVPVTLPAS